MESNGLLRGLINEEQEQTGGGDIVSKTDANREKEIKPMRKENE